MRVVVVSTFYPNAFQPLRTLFVRNLVVALADYATVTVVAPLPYAPPLLRNPSWGALRAVAHVEERDGLQVNHPRFVALPGIEALNGATFALAILPILRSLQRTAQIDVVHAHCAYPDAVGVAIACAWLDLPFVVTAHGSDINVYANKHLIRRQLRWALRRAKAVIAVSAPLGRKLLAVVPEIGARLERIACAGVDPTIFHAMNRASVRRELSLPEAARVVLFVGQLVPIKRLDLLLAAWRGLLRDARIGRDDRLLLIGEGPLRAPLELQASADDFGGSVCFLGGRPQVEVARWVSAADLLCLPSDNEGTPNVIVEALASGRPVVATAVGGIPELVIPNVNGVLVLPGDAPGLQAGLAAALVQKWDAAQIAATVSGYTWQALAQSNFALLTRVVAESSQVKHAPD